MVRSIVGRLLPIPFAEADVRDTRPRQRDGESRDEKPRVANPEALPNSWADENADLDEEVGDWDEYGDEIASAVAFAAWQEASAHTWDWDEDDASVEAERGEAPEFGQNREDWAADDVLEDYASYY